MPVLQSLIADRWIGSREGAALASAIDGATIHHAHADEIDFGEALSFARRSGGAALLALDFQQRAARLKALAAYVSERKEELYAISRHTGATRSDGWVDIEGGTGTLYAYASMGGNELPSGNVLNEGPPVVLGKKGQFAASHILVPRGGVAVHINAFNFPVWGLLEKFAPTFLAGMPCIAKPATATSYLTEALVRMMMGSGILPPGSLQLVIGPTGDLLDRLESSDVVTFTGSAASKAQQADVAARLELLAKGNEIVFGAGDGFAPKGEGVSGGAFFAPTLVLCRDGMKNDAVHDVEAFGPVSTLMPYEDFDEAMALAARGRGSLVATLVTHDPKVAAKAIPQMAAWHGRLLVLDRASAGESTGHGSPLPMLKHGGPGRAGGGEELGGIRAVKHFLQRAAVQGSPTMLPAVSGEDVRGG